MATGVKSWSTTAATNATADSNINWAEGQAPSTVNDSSRQVMAAIAAWFALIDQGTVSNGTVGGTAGAITLTCSPTVDARVAGQRYAFKLGSAVIGATTLAVDGLASGAVQWNQTALSANDFAANDWVMVIDDGTNYQLVTPPKLSFYAQVNNLTADGTGAVGDKIPTIDVSASNAPKYILISTLQTLLAASAAQQETGTSNAVNVTPGVQHRHASAAKFWNNMDGSGTAAIVVSYNVTSITDNGTGDYTTTIATDFSGASWAGAWMNNAFSTASIGGQYSAVRSTDASAMTAGTVRMQCGTPGDGVYHDTPIHCVMGFGDQ